MICVYKEYEVKTKMAQKYSEKKFNAPKNDMFIGL